MIKRLKTSVGVVAGLSALALGGPAMAGAATTTPAKASPKHESTTRPDRDKLQRGSKTTHDRKGKPARVERTSHPDRDKLQRGSKTTPDRKGKRDRDKVQHGSKTTPDRPGAPKAA
jgi:hypothetical protein